MVDLQQGRAQRPLPRELPGEDIGEHLTAEVTKGTLSLMNLLTTGCDRKLSSYNQDRYVGGGEDLPGEDTGGLTETA